MGRNIEKLSKKDTPESTGYLHQYLSHIVRMQEEIGTGGAGFRFIYASFLKETGKLLSDDVLLEGAERMSTAGDEWRKFALVSSKMCKGRSPMDGEKLAHILNECADLEKQAWQCVKAFKA